MASMDKQPDIDIQELLSDVMSKEPEKFEFLGKERNVRWLTFATLRKFTRIMIKEKDEFKRCVKLAACIMCSGFWRLKFRYPFYWRWLYYIKDVDASDCLRAVVAGKKKLPQAAYTLITIFSTGMMDTIATMTAREAKQCQAEQNGGQPSLLQKNSPSSSREDGASKHGDTGTDTPSPKSN